MTIEEIMRRDIAEIDREQRTQRDRAEAAHMLNKWREKHPYRRHTHANAAVWTLVALFALAAVAVAVRAYIIRQDLNNARAAWAADRAN